MDVFSENENSNSDKLRPQSAVDRNNRVCHSSVSGGLMAIKGVDAYPTGIRARSQASQAPHPWLNPSAPGTEVGRRELQQKLRMRPMSCSAQFMRSCFGEVEDPSSESKITEVSRLKRVQQIYT